MSRAWIKLLTCLCMFGVAAPSGAADEEGRLADLEREVAELKATIEAKAEADARAARDEAGRNVDWTRYIRLGGSANLGWYGAEANSVSPESRFQVRDARFFVDVELGAPLDLAGFTVVRNAGFSFEWNLVRIGTLQNTVGDLYVEFQGIADSGWLNVQLGRFQIPVGEAYLRYGSGYWTNPFISNPVAGTWWWDEGVKLYGGDASGLFSYVASITENATAFNASVSSQKQYSLKLITDATPWLRISGSFLYGGNVGSATDPGSGGGLWVGETWGRGIGVDSSLPVYQAGVVVPDGPNEVERSWFGGADAVVDIPNAVRLWLSYGFWTLDSPDATYDRQLHSWIAELVLDGNLLSSKLDGLYLGARASGIGTYDASRGYSLDFRTLDQYGYNMSSLQEYSVVLGWRPIQYVVIRAEYSHTRIGVVDGVPASTLQATDDVDAWGVEVGVHF